MAELEAFKINDTLYSVKDATARETADKVANEAEYNRQESISQFPGRSLAAVFADEIGKHANIYAWLSSRAKAANFDGLRIGDYMDVPIKAGANIPAQTLRYHIAAIDPYYNCSDQPMPHHITFIPAEPALASGSNAVDGVNLKWNDTATNNGDAAVKEPYLASKLHDWEISDFLPALPTELQEVLISYRSLSEQRYSSTNAALTEASGWIWSDLGKVWSLSEMEVYGCPIWGSNGYSVGTDCHFPIFASTSKRLLGYRARSWLRSVMGGSASNVCAVGNYGNAYNTSATYGGVRPRPCFHLG